MHKSHLKLAFAPLTHNSGVKSTMTDVLRKSMQLRTKHYGEHIDGFVYRFGDVWKYKSHLITLSLCLQSGKKPQHFLKEFQYS